MSRETIDDEIVSIITEQFGARSSDLSDETTMAELEVDDLDYTVLATKYEEAFDIFIDINEFEKITKVGAIIAFIRKRMSQRMRIKKELDRMSKP